MARRRRSATKVRSRRKYKKRNPFQLKLKQQTIYTVGAIWLWLIAGIVTISFFGDSALLTTLRQELLLHIGWVMYILPVFLVVSSLMFFKLKSDIARPNVPFGIAIFMVSLLGLFQQGIAGEVIWSFVAFKISTEGAVLTFITLAIIGIICIFNSSLDAVMNYVLLGGEAIIAVFGGWLDKFFAKKGIGGLDENTQLKIKGLDYDKQSAVKPPAPLPPISPKNAPTGDSVKSDINIKNPTLTKQEDMSLWEAPPLSILSDGPGQKADRGDLKQNANTIIKTLESFGIKADMAEVNRGPAVTQYAIKPYLGTKVSKITSLSSDLALALAAPTGQVRIEAPIPGRDLVGIEIPNRGLEFVTLKKMLESPVMRQAKSKLSVAMGLDVSGDPVIADIAKMPHALVAGTTGSGKSVLINAWITTLLYRTNPSEVRLILVDPKRVELAGYNGIPHLLIPVIVEPDKILSALRWATGEMEHRYKQFAEVGVRNIDGFNEMSGFQSMPNIVIFIDELADLMAYAPVEVEDTICRLAQMARATGIHLVLSTQRPSVDVITGLIKANIPTRIAFNVSSMTDSRVVLDLPGAEKLLGRGDMLYIPPDQAKPSRIQGTYVSEQEVSRIVEYLKTKNPPVQYTEEVTSQKVSLSSKKGSGGGSSTDGKDNMFEDALRLICQYDKASASLLQRRLSVGYARAARILDQLEDAGIIGPAEGSKPRDVLVKNPDEYLAQQQSSEGV